MERIRNLRENKDLIQEKSANILNCSQTSYSRYETGNLNISVDSLMKLAIYFNTSIDYLTELLLKKIIKGQ